MSLGDREPLEFQQVESLLIQLEMLTGEDIALVPRILSQWEKVERVERLKRRVSLIDGYAWRERDRRSLERK